MVKAKEIGFPDGMNAVGGRFLYAWTRDICARRFTCFAGFIGFILRRHYGTFVSEPLLIRLCAYICEFYFNSVVVVIGGGGLA